MPGTRPLSWRTENGMQVLYLGEVPIGRVAPEGGRHNKPRWLFHLACHTPGIGTFWHSAPDQPKAKVDLLTAAHDWLNRAGWV